jgi:hypothetical protein
MDAVFADAPWVREFQLMASSTTRIDVSVIPSRPVTEQERRTVEQRFQDRLGPGARSSLKLVDALPLGSDEKFRLVVRS